MADKEQKWITVNGTHIPLDEDGEITGKVADKIKKSSGSIDDLGSAVYKSREYKEAAKRVQDAWDKWREADAKLKTIPSKKPESEMTEDDRILIDTLGKSYWPVNKEWIKVNEEKEKAGRIHSQESEKARQMLLNAEPPVKLSDMGRAKDATANDYDGFYRSNTGTSLSLRGARICEMSPKEYLERCAGMFNETTGHKTNLTMQIRGLDRKTIDELKEKISSGKKMYTPWLDERGVHGQEGRHRAAAAYELGIEKIPVVYFDKNTRTDADDVQWITVNGAHIPIGEDGDLKGRVGNKIEKESEKKNEEGTKRTAVKKFYHHDGSVIGNHVLDYKNNHVSEDDRVRTKKDVATTLYYARMQHGYYSPKAFESAGKYLRDEITDRHKLRKKDGLYYDKQIQVEDIYDALKDVRDFGKPESFKQIKVSNPDGLDQKRVDAIVKEATDMFPTDWYNEIEDGHGVTIMIHDTHGRANFSGWLGDSTIHIFAEENPKTVKDLGVPKKLCDNAIVSQLTHELGHYMEWAHPGVRDVAQRFLEERTKKSETMPLEDGYDTKPDSFFSTYMGKQYWDGSTEITSMLAQGVRYGNPFEHLSGKDFISDSRDPGSLKFILGMFGGL